MQTRKITFLICLFFSTILSVNAQEWMTDLEEAKKIATEQNLKILISFQGSDWCAPCIKLNKEILSSEAFVTYAKSHFVMVKADFPRRKKNKLSAAQQKKNNQLAEKYDKQGIFPLVVMLDKNGNVLGRTGYKNMAPAEYSALLSSF